MGVKALCVTKTSFHQRVFNYSTQSCLFPRALHPPLMEWNEMFRVINITLTLLLMSQYSDWLVEEAPLRKTMAAQPQTRWTRIRMTGNNELK